MKQPIPPKTPANRLLRIACILTGAGVVIAGSTFFGGPQPSAADPVAKPTGRLLGELEGTDFRVRITSGADGPLYTVISKDGRTLLVDATVSEVTAMFPTLNLEHLKAKGGTTGPLMLADPEE